MCDFAIHAIYKSQIHRTRENAGNQWGAEKMRQWWSNGTNFQL